MTHSKSHLSTGGRRSPLALSCRFFCLLSVFVHLTFLLFSSSFIGVQGRSPFIVGDGYTRGDGFFKGGEGAGLSPRRLVVGWTLRKFFFMKTPETLLAERARSLRFMAPGCDYGLQFLYSVVLVAGKHTAARSSLIDTSMEDVLVAFFRLAELEKETFPLQWYAVETALRRSHARALQMALRRQQAEQQDYENDPDREKPLDLTVPEYTWMLGQQTRDAEWYFDGSTFHKRGVFTVPEKLTDHEIGFFKSLPFNVVRVARGIEREKPTKSVQHLIDELQQRGVKTANDFFVHTNFLDLLFSTNVIDETLLQIDILSEYVSNWEAFRANKLTPPSIPVGNGLPDLLQTLTSKKTTKEKYPKCPTMRCYAEHIWQQRAEHPIDKEDKQRDPNEEKKKEPSSEPFAELLIKKTTSNALKVVAIGNTGQSKYEKTEGFFGRIRNALKLNEFQETVAAMKQWHEKESVDIGLGLGDFLQPPGMLSVKDPGFKEKWHDIFVKDARLDIPWYLVNGEAESMVTSSANYRYHYSRQDLNMHNPNWLYKSVITMVANLTTADGAAEDQEFTVHVISVDTWALFGGPPFYDNLGQYQNNLIALSNMLYHSAKAKADWIIVQGHHPLTSTGPEAEEARFAYIDDMVKSGRPRGPEHRLVDLLNAYQVDAYISGHDNALEYVTMSDLDKNSTLAFITSGGGTSIMGGVMGRGWLGRLRGRLYPLLCWSGKRVFYKLDPGGCKPSEKDQALAYKFYAPQGPNWKISVKERILNTTGFVSMKFTKDFLIVDFISSTTGKPTGRKMHKQTNRAARAVKFIDFWEDADLKLKELNLDHEAFEEENRERVASEIAFQSRTPILAERLRMYEKELMDMYSEYQHLKSKKAMYETMNAQKAAALEAQGENLRESELSEGMYEQTERIIELMYIIVSHHMYMWERYQALKEVRKTLPPHDVKYAEALLKLEKKLVEVMKQRRDLNKKYVDQNNHPTPADVEQIKEYAMKASILKRDIKEFEQVMQEEEKKEAGSQEGKKEGETEEKPPTAEAKEELPDIKPLDQSINARLERKKKQLEEHERVLQSITSLPASEREKMKEDIGMLQRQREKLKAEVDKLEGILNRREWAADRRPSELWEKRLQMHDLGHTLKHLDAYKESIAMLPKVQRRTKDLNDAVANIELQKIEIEEQLMDLADELYNTEPTPLQEKFLEQLDRLREVSILVDSRNTMPAEALEDPEIQKSLQEAKDALETLQLEVDTADEELRKQLNLLDEAWVKRMIIRGADMKQLAEEFSIDVEAVLDEDAKAREADPHKQLKWVEEQISMFEDRLSAIAKLPPERKEKFESDRKQIEARVKELRKQREEALEAIKLKAGEKVEQTPETKEEKDEQKQQEKQPEQTPEDISKKETQEEVIKTEKEVDDDDILISSISPTETAADTPTVSTTTTAEPTDEDILLPMIDDEDTSSSSGEAALSTSSTATATTATATTTKTIKEGEETKNETIIDEDEDIEDEEMQFEDLNISSDNRSDGRRLAALMEWLQPKKEETPVKELPKIDLGPKDPCEGEPMIYVVVRKAINAEYGANFADKCKKVFANRVHRQQRRFLGLFDDSGTPAFYDKPHPHILRGLQSYYGLTKIKTLVHLLKHIKYKLLHVSSKIHVATYEETLKNDDVPEQKEEDEFVVLDDD